MTHNVAGSSNTNNNNHINKSVVLVPSPSLLSLINQGDATNEIKLLEEIIDTLITNNRAGFSLEASFAQPNHLLSFVSYALNRRFGWSENKTNTLQEHKQSLNNLLDSFTHLLCNQCFTPLLCDILLSSASSSSYSSTSSFSTSSPSTTVSHVVRDQTYKLLFDWIKCQYTLNDVIVIQFDNEDIENGLETHSEENSDQSFNPTSANMYPVDLPSVIRVIVSGLTDVWSAIRNSCASRMLSLLETFDISALETLFHRLSAICGDATASWQAKEGAALGIVAIIKSFRLEPIKVFAQDQSQPSLVLLLGRNRYEGLPTWLHDQARNLLFPLLSHPQLSIREIAKKGLVAFHARSPCSDLLITRDQLVRSLLSLPPSPAPLPDTSLLPTTHPITDPYAAEGLLSVCNTILRADTQGLFAYDDWAHQLHAYILYLAHPASTVRIEASSIFKQIVTKYTDSPFVIQMVLQCLGAGWHFPFHSALLPPHIDSLPYLPLSHSVQDTVPSPPSWEWKEGRLLAYELVFSFLLANHIHYTQPHSHKMRRASKTKLSFSTPTTPNSSAPNTPSTPSRPSNPNREGLARSVSLERVDSGPPTIPVSYPRPSNRIRRNSSSTQDERPVMISSQALSLIEQLAAGNSVMPSSLPFLPPLPIATILQHISAQVAESFGFPRWEINRMAEQVLRPLVDTLYLLGVAVNATLSISLATPNSPTSTPSTPVFAETNQENSTSNIPMLCLLWYHPFVESFHPSTQKDVPKPTTDSPQRPNQKMRQHFLSHSRRDSLSHLPSDKGHRVRSFSNPQFRLTIPTQSVSPSTQFMACKSLRHSLMIIANRQYSVRARDEPFCSLTNTSPHRPHSPNIQTTSYQTPNTITNWSPTSVHTRPSSPNVDRRSWQPTIAKHILANLEVVQQRVLSLIVGLLEASSNATAANDDRLVVTACELLVIISVGDWMPTADIAGNSQVIVQVFQWMARLSHSRKSKIEGQLLSALHPHLIKFIQRIPLNNKTSINPSATKSNALLTLACYLVPLIPTHADPVLQTSLLDAVAAALDKLPLDVEEQTDFFDLDNLKLLCTLCTKWLVKLVTKPLEGSVLRSALGVLHRVVRVVLNYNMPSEAILSHIFKAIAGRLSPFIPQSPISDMPPMDTLSLHSNEIIHSWDNRDIDSDFEDEEDEEEDDWDDEDDTAGGEVVEGECIAFLLHLKAKDPGAVSKILLLMSTHERSVLCWALSKNDATM